MKRYDSPLTGAVMRESATGDYVKFEDVERLVDLNSSNSFNKNIEDLRQAASDAESGYMCGLLSWACFELMQQKCKILSLEKVLKKAGDLK